MSGKPRVMITIHHRDELSLGDNRERLGLSAYHWAILVQPKKPKGPDSNSSYDVSDSARPDPMTRQDLSPDRDWHFRPKRGVDPVLSGRLLGKVMVGKVPRDVTDAIIESILKDIPLPVKDVKPVQNCVTWISTAIEVMQRKGLAEVFDVNRFMTEALELADEWVRNPGPNNFANYSSRAA